MKKGFLASDDPKVSKIRPPQQQAPKTPEGKYTFEHFELERLLGCGNFSEVFEVTEKGTANTYALKVFNRHDVMRLNKVADVRMERHAMLRLNDPGHPNIIRLLETFKDEFRVCFLYELAEGGELWDHVKYAGLMDKQWARCVISQLVSAVEYMHSKNIVHRDLKAENLVLTRDGTLKLIDLGNAMDLDHPEVAAPGLGTIPSSASDSFGLRMSGRRAVRRPTFQHYVGTPQFMPPEAVKNKDSGKLRDLWSLGCLIYQILTGSPPFSGSTDYFIVLRVEAGNVDFPPDFDPLARDLVERLLVADPEKRLGAKGFHEIKSHPYFEPGCFDPPGSSVRIFPSVQELCMRNVLKRFHGVLVAAMDKARQNKYMPEQAGKIEPVGHGGGEAERQSEEVQEKRTEGGFPTVQGNQISGGCSVEGDIVGRSGDERYADWPVAETGVESADKLLDQVVPRELREQPRERMSPHLQTLIDRLEYCLRTQGRQFLREFMKAEEWERKHAQQSNSSDEDSSQEEGASEKGVDS